MSTATTELIPIQKASAHFPNRPSTGSIWRWVLKGSRGVKLNSVVIAGRRYLTSEAIAEFIRATTAAANGASVPNVRVSSKQREKEIARAERSLNEP